MWSFKDKESRRILRVSDFSQCEDLYNDLHPETGNYIVCGREALSEAQVTQFNPEFEYSGGGKWMFYYGKSQLEDKFQKIIDGVRDGHLECCMLLAHPSNRKRDSYAFFIYTSSCDSKEAHKALEYLRNAKIIDSSMNIKFKSQSQTAKNVQSHNDPRPFLFSASELDVAVKKKVDEKEQENVRSSARVKTLFALNPKATEFVPGQVAHTISRIRV